MVFCQIVFTQTPIDFEYESSTQLGFYIFYNVKINDVQIQDDDWVGAFKCNEWNSQTMECVNFGPCVGSRRWGECSESEYYPACDVPVFGDDGSELTDGYMVTGELPAFKVYSVMYDAYYNGIPSSYHTWEYMITPQIESLDIFDETISGCTDPDYDEYNPYAIIDDGSCLSLGFESEIPTNLQLDGVFPNPFNPSTNIHFTISENTKLEISIYTIMGEKIDHITSGEYLIGEYTIQWIPKSENSSGIYFIQLKTTNETLLQSVTLIK